MATHESLVYPLHIENIQSYQKLDAKSIEISCEYGKELLSESSKSVELEILEEDLSELTHILHITKRPMVKEVIQMDIEMILAKIESLRDTFKEQFETKVSWTKVAAMKHKKYNYKGQRIEETFPATSKWL
jgi:DNA-directed RNA polymerase subunit L